MWIRGEPVDASERLNQTSSDETHRMAKTAQIAPGPCRSAQLPVLNPQPGGAATNARQTGQGIPPPAKAQAGFLLTLTVGRVRGRWLREVEHGTIENGAAIRQLLRQADREVARAAWIRPDAALDTPTCPGAVAQLAVLCGQEPRRQSASGSAESSRYATQAL